MLHYVQVLHRTARSGRPISRNFSQSAPAFKKRSAKALKQGIIEDPFAEPDLVDDELFSSKAKPTTKRPSPPPSTSTLKASSRKSTSPATLFEEQFTFVTDRLGPNARVRSPQIRDNALRRLLHHSENGAQLERLANLLVAWRESGKRIDRSTTLELIDRCLNWHPALLVQLFADRPRYGVDIPDIAEARRILHRLVNSLPHPVAQSTSAEARKATHEEALRHAASFASLYPKYGLPHATADLTSCALLAQACARALSLREGADALAALVPALTTALGAKKSTRGPPVANADAVDRIGKGDHAESVLSRRESGFTQSGAVEWKWVNMGVQDVLGVLKNLTLKRKEEYAKALNSQLLGSDRLLHSI